MFEREKNRFSIRKNKCYGACSVFLGLTILTLAMAGGNVKAEEVLSENSVSVIAPEVADNTNLEEPTLTTNEVLAPRAFQGGADSNEELIKNALITVTELTLENDKLEESDSAENELNFSNADSLKAKFSIEAEQVSKGDNFEVVISNNLSVNGITTDDFSIRPDVNIKDNDGGIIAKPTFDPKRHVLTYTFTDYAALKRDIEAYVELELTLDTKRFSKPVKDEEFFVSIGNKKETVRRDVTFTPVIAEDLTNANIDALFTKTSITNKSFTYVTQINPLGEEIYSPGLTNFVTDIFNDVESKYRVDFSNINVKIYQMSPSNMSKTLEQDYSSAIDVTNKIRFSTSKDSVHIEWDKARFRKDEGYVIVLEKLDNTSFEDNNETSLTSELKNKSVLTDNGAARTTASYFVVYNKENATASDAKYSIGDFVWEDTNKDGVQDEEESKKGISGVTVLLLDAEGKQIKEQQTGPKGEYKFTDLSGNTTYFLKFESVPGYVRTKQNSQVGSKLKPDDFDSDASSTGLAIAKITNSNRTDIDAGYYKEEVKKGSFTEHHIYEVYKDGVKQEDLTTNIDIPTTSGKETETFTTSAKPDGTKEDPKKDFIFQPNETKKSLEITKELDGKEVTDNYQNDKDLAVTYVYRKDITTKGSFTEHHIYEVYKDGVKQEDLTTNIDIPTTSGKETETFTTSAKPDGTKEDPKKDFIFQPNETKKSLEITKELDGKEVTDNYQNDKDLAVTYVYRKDITTKGSFTEHHIYEVYKDGVKQEDLTTNIDIPTTSGKETETFTTSAKPDGTKEDPKKDFIFQPNETKKSLEITKELDGKEVTDNYQNDKDLAVTYVYRKDISTEGNVLVDYVIKGTNDRLRETYTDTPLTNIISQGGTPVTYDTTEVKDNYHEKPNTILGADGWTYKLDGIRNDSDKEQGNLEEGMIRVVYEYLPVKGDVIVDYVIEGTDTKLQDTYTDTKLTNITDHGNPVTYDTAENNEKPDTLKDDNGLTYKLVGIKKGSDTEQGNLKEGTIHVTYEYRLVPIEGDVIVDYYIEGTETKLRDTYQDTPLKNISDTDGRHVTYNTTENDEKPKYLVKDGDTYELVGRRQGSDLEIGELKEGTRHIIYDYRKLIMPKGDFVEHHIYRTVDEQGNVVEEEFENVPVTEGTSKDTFNTAKRDRAGYKLVEVTSSTETAFNLDGKAKENHYRDNRGQEVTYVYVRVRINDTRSNLVTFEEVLPNESGQNAGTVEIEENAPIVELEYPSQEGMSGENAGTVEVEENAPIVELDYPSQEGMSGENAGTVEIEESSPIVELDYPSQEGMSGENAGTVEVEENAPIVELDYPSQESMSGENIGQQTIEEDTPTVTIKEKPVVKPVSSQPSKAELPATGERSETAVTVLGLALSALGLTFIRKRKQN
ncbi:SdrD B-like domain-containing protein [Streptococcus dysgalactiae]|uniref:SdrD B-like domain-containing protein n=1 Tax=Streptococcus dysgalactiae TaxID=1334 RepID=UPI0018C8B28E|nr:SdrD B-like domain-containing protein [Streptococcus dysgalactiae]